MGKGVFASWELWEQMTFVLAMSIVIVFCSGLVKLWWTNRILRKQEVMDEKKRSRTEQMRRAGILSKCANEIPFGVRAIQSGIEVDGIWISRPATPNLDYKARTSPTSTLISLDSHSLPKGKAGLEEGISASPLAPAPNTLEAQPTGLKERDYEIGKSRRACYLYDPSRSLHGLNVHQSASTESISQTSSNDSGSSRRSLKLHARQNTADNRNTPPHASPFLPTLEGRDPFTTPQRTPSSFPSSNLSGLNAPHKTGKDVTIPEPTFGPGDVHLNRASRIVNQGFEVLPAGTFGRLHNVSSDSDAADAEGQRE